MGVYYQKPCENCGGSMNIRRDWDHPPRFCKPCKAKFEAQFYDKVCESCHKTKMRVSREWAREPRFCGECRENFNANFYEISCEGCDGTIHAHRDWQHPPKYCGKCKDSNPPITAGCSHCGRSFDIWTGTRIHCAKNGWDLPKRCERCRELFRHRPFRTVGETTTTGATVFKTYNSRGDLISESRDERGIFGDTRRVHRSRQGKTTGVTRERTGIFGNRYRETRAPDGTLKSRSRERSDIFGNKYTESLGGSSLTKRVTRSLSGIFGRYLETR